MTPVVSLIVGVAIVLLITLGTAWFVAQEFAYVAVDRSKLAARAESGDKAAARTLEITRRTSFLLSGAQLGITVTGLLVGYVAEPLIGQALGSIFTKGQSTAVSVAIGGVVALVFSTLVQMLFGELVPKNYAIARSSETADALAVGTQIYLKIFGPIIWVFDKAAELLLKSIHIEPVHDVENAASASDLGKVVAASRESGTLSADLSMVIDRILDFPNRTVEHAMVPRVRVAVVRDTATIGETRAKMADGHTRYPVLDAEETVVGIVHLKDLLATTLDDDQPVTAIARKALAVPEFMALPEAQDQIRNSGQKLACVVDEFGSFTGIVTQEDLAEEIVGELVDEHDPDLSEYELRVADGVWLMAGDVHVDEVERSLGLVLPSGDYETISGLIIHELGDLPQPGAVIELHLEPTPAQLALDGDAPARRVHIEVLEVQRHVPARVRITCPTTEEEES